MSRKNLVILIGNVGKDPEIKSFDNGNKGANFSLATSEKWTDKNTGELKTKTEWHNVAVFGRKTDIVEKYVKKGSQIYVEGQLHTRSWEKDGITRYVTEIILKDFRGELVLLGGRANTNNGQPLGNTEQLDNVVNNQGGDDLPF